MQKQISDCLKKYSYRVEWSEEDGVYIAKALEVPSILAHADTQEDAIREVKIPLAMALEAMVEEGEKLPEPLSLVKFRGKLVVRTTPEKHRELTIQAAEAGVSVNQYILTKIS